MGKVTWGGGMDADTLNDAERSQFKPYDGPVPPNALYCWRVKVLKKGKSQADNNKLIIGLELVPRRSRPDEKPYAGYFATESIAVVESMAGKLGSFLDAIGVTGSDFLNRTLDDGEKDQRGNTKIIKIGKWINDGKTYILASLGDDSWNGETRKRIQNFWPVEQAAKAEPEESDETEEEEEEQPRRTTAKKAAPKRREPEPDEDEAEEEESPRRPAAKKAAKKAAPKRRAQEDEDEDAGESDDEDDEAPF